MKENNKDEKVKEENMEEIWEDRFHFRKKHRRGIVWPIILVTVGSVLLLNNLGILPWGVWESLWRLWPLLLVIIGVNMIFGRSGFGSLIVGIFFTIIVFLIIAIIVAQYDTNFANWMLTNFPGWSEIRNLVPRQTFTPNYYY